VGDEEEDEQVSIRTGGEDEMGHTFPYHMTGRGSNFEISSVNTKNPERV
jgi:hypothetical protein